MRRIRFHGIVRSCRLGFVPVATLLLLMPGCRTVAQCCTSHFVARNSTPADATPLPTTSPAATRASFSSPEATPTETNAEADVIDPAADAQREEFVPQSSDRNSKRFRIPPELPGADAAPLQLPPIDPTQSPEQRRSLTEALFPEIPQSADTVNAGDDRVLELSALQQLATEHSPVIRLAATQVEKARGQAVQAGLYPNPTVGYQGDTIGTARTAGYNGVFFSQEFVTADKLTLAQNVSLMEMKAAAAELQKSRVGLATSVRRGYAQVLVAQEKLKFASALAGLSEEVYRAQIDLVSVGESAPYEPLQLRVFAVQGQNAVTQARNELQARWRQLAAAIGVPRLAHHRVAGAVETQISAPDYDQSVEFLMQQHTDVRAARARISKAECALRLQQVTPIPNVSLYSAFQHDDTTPLSDFSANLQVSVPVPLFDRNQGNITSAHAELVRANQDLVDTQNRLMSQFAEIRGRFSTSRVIARSYRTDLLPDQVRAYRGIHERFRIGGGAIDFSQLVVAQQQLSQIVNSYLDALASQWESTVDQAEILQVDDLMALGTDATNTAVSDTAVSDTAVTTAAVTTAAARN